MTRKLATIAEVESVAPIEGADFLETITLKNRFWRLVVKKDSVKPGDRGVYFEIDSVLPEVPQYEFLRERCFVDNANNKGFRIKTMKLRGQVSQGLFVPLTDYAGTEIGCVLAESAGDEGKDVTDILGVQLYENSNEGLLAGGILGPFPAFIPKTDQERIQNLPEFFEKYRDEEFEITTKLDGSSHTVAWCQGEFYVCGRNTRLEYDDADPKGDFAQLVKQLRLFEKLRDMNRNIALQGEFVGPGIQSNRAKFAEKSFFVFDVFDIDRQAYLLAGERYELTNKLFGFQVGHVPILTARKVFADFPDFATLMRYADGTTVNGTRAEGIVCKMLSDPSVSFKVISNQYLLKSGT